MTKDNNIAVVMSVLDHDKYVGDALVSVMNATAASKAIPNLNISLFVIDDGSTDNSLEAVEKFQRQNRHHFRNGIEIFRHETREGTNASLNELFGAVLDHNISFDAVTILDSDDMLMPWFFDATYPTLMMNAGKRYQGRRLGFVYGHPICWADDGSYCFQGYSRQFNAAAILDPDNKFRSYIPANILMSRDCLEDSYPFSGTDVTVGTKLSRHVEMVEKGWSGYLIGDYWVFVYRGHDSNISEIKHNILRHRNGEGNHPIFSGDYGQVENMQCPGDDSIDVPELGIPDLPDSEFVLPNMRRARLENGGGIKMDELWQHIPA